MVVGAFVLAAICLFFLLTFNLGLIRFDAGRYAEYKVTFDDVSGLVKKAEVRISGVRVGQVEDVCLDAFAQAVDVHFTVDKKYPLYIDAHAVVRQDGLLGGKYLEMYPGSPGTEILAIGSYLKQKKNVTALTLDMAMAEGKKIGDSLYNSLASLENVFKQQGFQGDIGVLMHEVYSSVKRLNECVQACEIFISSLQEASGSVGNDVAGLIHELRNELPRMIQELRELSSRVDNAMIPTTEIAHAISNKEGTIGKLIYDDAPYNDLCTVSNSMRSCVERIHNIAFVFDLHSETMMKRTWKDSWVHETKGYFDVRIHTCRDYFYLIGMVLPRFGKIKREQICIRRYDENGCEIPFDPQKLDYADQQLLAPDQYIIKRNLNKPLLNLQIARIFGNCDFAIRAGIFQSTAGVGFDWQLPISPSSLLRYVTTLEIYDFMGQLHMHEHRPHVKWLNRLFISPYFYIAFGGDDLATQARSGFIGAGIRFADKDLAECLLN
jgi:phospholipid/cholesterol/gamma-HCH transport system substrate-binding protein